LPQDLEIELEQLTRDEAIRAAWFLANVVDETPLITQSATTVAVYDRRVEIIVDGEGASGICVGRGKQGSRWMG